MSDPISITDLAARLFGPAVTELVSGVAQQTLPDCMACSKNAVPFRCIVCDSYVCQDHGYHSITRRECICRKCILDFMSVEFSPEEFSPYEVLNIPEHATRGEVERAFRLKAKKCHPDVVGDDPRRAREFRQLQWAREIILEKVRD